MFAIIKSGGKQYRVQEGDVLSIERVSGEAGDKVTFDEVLMMGEGDSVKVGSPTVSGASVTGEIMDQYRTRRILIFRKRRRKNSERMNGHRQQQSLVKITGIK